MSPKKLINSFKYAFRGVSRVWREEQNFRIQSCVALFVVILMVYLDLPGYEQAILMLAAVAVLVLELLNSAIERMVDMLKPRLHQYVEEIKDVTAAMVLVASLGAAVIGVLIFWPYLVTFSVNS